MIIASSTARPRPSAGTASATSGRPAAVARAPAPRPPADRCGPETAAAPAPDSRSDGARPAGEPRAGPARRTRTSDRSRACRSAPSGTGSARALPSSPTNVAGLLDAVYRDPSTTSARPSRIGVEQRRCRSPVLAVAVEPNRRVVPEPRGVTKAGAHRAADAHALREPQPAHVERLEDRRRPIGRSVVDHEQVEVGMALRALRRRRPAGSRLRCARESGRGSALGTRGDGSTRWRRAIRRLTRATCDRPASAHAVRRVSRHGPTAAAPSTRRSRRPRRGRERDASGKQERRRVRKRRAARTPAIARSSARAPATSVAATEASCQRRTAVSRPSPAPRSDATIAIAITTGCSIICSGDTESPAMRPGCFGDEIEAAVAEAVLLDAVAAQTLAPAMHAPRRRGRRRAGSRRAQPIAHVVVVAVAELSSKRPTCRSASAR